MNMLVRCVRAVSGNMNFEFSTCLGLGATFGEVGPPQFPSVFYRLCGSCQMRAPKDCYYDQRCCSREVAYTIEERMTIHCM